VRDPKALVGTLAARIKSLISDHAQATTCEGVGVVVPGMVEHATMRVLHAPTLGWRNVDLREPLASATGLRVLIENSGRACALAQMWAQRGHTTAQGDLVFISVSDGLGVGVIMNGEVLRGRHNIAGEFGHVPLSLDGPRCSCGANGCWEAYVSNRATLNRYFGRANTGPQDAQQRHFTVEDLIARARGGDAKAVAALEATARYLGLGLASVINALDPACVHVGGEITLAWDLIEGAVRAALAERALTPAAAATDIRPVAAGEHPRLQGAAALVTAPAFAAPVVA
jgi:predicted NBD/HSP70 family sugar kinase